MNACTNCGWTTTAPFCPCRPRLCAMCCKGYCQDPEDGR